MHYKTNPEIIWSKRKKLVVKFSTFLSLKKAPASKWLRFKHTICNYTHTQKLGKKKNTENIENHIFIERKKNDAKWKKYLKWKWREKKKKKQEGPSKGRTRKIQSRSSNIDPTPYFLGFPLGLRERRKRDFLLIELSKLHPLPRSFNSLNYFFLQRIKREHF